MGKIGVTNHALERFEERVTKKWSHLPNARSKASEWLTTALDSAKFIRAQDDGNLQWRYENNVIVTDEEMTRVITIRPTQRVDEVAPDVEDSIKDVVKRTILRMIRPLCERQHKILIEIHTQELAKIRVHHPATKKIISGRIESLHEQLDEITKDIQAHSSVGHKYGINIESDM